MGDAPTQQSPMTPYNNGDEHSYNLTSMYVSLRYRMFALRCAVPSLRRRYEAVIKAEGIKETPAPALYIRPQLSGDKLCKTEITRSRTDLGLGA